MDLSLVFRQGDGVLMSVFLLLLAMSVTSWWLILRRSLSRWSVRQANQQLSQAFWDAPDLDAAARLAEQHDAPLARIARAGIWLDLRQPDRAMAGSENRCVRGDGAHDRRLRGQAAPCARPWMEAPSASAGSSRARDAAGTHRTAPPTTRSDGSDPLR